MSAFQAAHVVDRLPSLLEYCSFMFSLGNMLAGPYLEFTPYKQFIELQGVSEMRGN
jgi:hypothetical protein